MNKDRAYTHDEIKRLADTGDFRFKALVLLLASHFYNYSHVNEILYTPKYSIC